MYLVALKLYYFDMSTLNTWLGQLDPKHSAGSLFEYLPNVLYFVKDRQGHIMTGNQAFAERVGCASPDELYGRRDDSLFPLYMVEKFRTDDATVFQTGEPLRDLVELFPTREGLPEWCVTHKIPLFDRTNEVVGLCGIVQSYEQMHDHHQRPIFKVVQYIRAHYAERLSIPDIAERFGFSQRQMERRFAETFRASPRQYITRLRVLIACEQLRSTEQPISEVALDCGFYDHSSFIRHFKRTLGITPLAYRKKHSGRGSGA